MAPRAKDESVGSSASRRDSGQRVGYARISTASQNLDSQRDALEGAGCSRVFEDTISGTSKGRPGWHALLEYARAGDTLVVTELSRMSRSLMHLLQVVAELAEREIGIVSLRESIDTSTASGRLFLSIMGAVSQMERELRAERAAAGRAAARARGRSGGRPRTPREALAKGQRLYDSGVMTAAEAAEAVGVSRRTLFRFIAEERGAKEKASSSASAPKPSSSSDLPALTRVGKGRYGWKQYGVESDGSGWMVREYRDGAGEAVSAEGDHRSLVKAHGFGRRVGRVATLDAARCLLAGHPVERAFVAQGVAADGSAKLRKLLPSGRGSAATFGWKHVEVGKGASGLWLLEALWTLDGDPFDVTSTGARQGEPSERRALGAASSLREAREKLPGFAERSLRDGGRRHIRIQSSAAA